MQYLQNRPKADVVSRDLICFPSHICLSPPEEAGEIVARIKSLPVNIAKRLRVQLCNYAFEQVVISECKMLMEDVRLRRELKHYEAIELWNNSFTEVLGVINLK